MALFEYDYRIHPAVGIARMGNGDAAYFLGPEKPWSAAQPFNPVQRDMPGHPGASRKAAAGKMRDLENKLCKQGVRFRVFCYKYELEEMLDARSQRRHLVDVFECTSDKFDIEWTAKVANGKASTANALPGGNAGILALPRQLNAPDPVTLRTAVAADKNKRTVFSGKPAGRLDLGSCFLDNTGGLTVLGSNGAVKQLPGSTAPPIDNGGNLFWPGWEDDAADGPVTAKVTAKASSGINAAQRAKKDAVGAWVIINMPAYGADVRAPVTLYDLALNHAYDQAQINVRKGQQVYLPALRNIATFYSVIRPLQHSQLSMPYVAEKKGAAAGTPVHQGRVRSSPAPDMNSAKYLATFMRPPRKTTESVPESIWEHYKGPWAGTPQGMPRDKGKVPDPDLTKNFMLYDPVTQSLPALVNPVGAMPDLLIVTVTELQSRALQDLQAGTLELGDLVAETSANIKFAPYQLDRANLDSMSGGSFFPGLETGRTANYPAVWVGLEGCCDAHFDVRFTYKVNEEGELASPPLAAAAGDLTFNLANPWQADFVACGRDFWPYTSLSMVQSAPAAAGGWKRWMFTTDPSVISGAAAGSPEFMSGRDESTAVVAGKVLGGFINAWFRVGFARYDSASTEVVEQERDPALGSVPF